MNKIIEETKNSCYMLSDNLSSLMDLQKSRTNVAINENEYKEKLDIKAFKAAIRIAKIKSKLGDSEISMEELLPAIESKICVS